MTSTTGDSFNNGSEMGDVADMTLANGQTVSITTSTPLDPFTLQGTMPMGQLVSYPPRVEHLPPTTKPAEPRLEVGPSPLMPKGANSAEIYRGRGGLRPGIGVETPPDKGGKTTVTPGLRYVMPPRPTGPRPPFGRGRVFRWRFGGGRR